MRELLPADAMVYYRPAITPIDLADRPGEAEAACPSRGRVACTAARPVTTASAATSATSAPGGCSSRPRARCVDYGLFRARPSVHAPERARRLQPLPGAGRGSDDAHIGPSRVGAGVSARVSQAAIRGSRRRLATPTPGPGPLPAGPLAGTTMRKSSNAACARRGAGTRAADAPRLGDLVRLAAIERLRAELQWLAVATAVKGCGGDDVPLPMPAAGDDAALGATLRDGRYFKCGDPDRRDSGVARPAPGRAHHASAQPLGVRRGRIP